MNHKSELVNKSGELLDSIMIELQNVVGTDHYDRLLKILKKWKSNILKLIKPNTSEKKDKFDISEKKDKPNTSEKKDKLNTSEKKNKPILARKKINAILVRKKINQILVRKKINPILVKTKMILESIINHQKHLIA